MRRLMLVGRILCWVLGTLAIVAALLWTTAFGGAGAGNVILTIGILQLGVALWLVPRDVIRPRYIDPAMLEPRRPPRRASGGATLLSTIVAMAIIALCLTMVLQAYIHGSRFVALQARRIQATAICQAQIELARARGYAALPAPGQHTFRAGDEVATVGGLIVERGPIAGSKQVTARVSWPANERLPAGQVELITIMAARGISP